MTSQTFDQSPALLPLFTRAILGARRRPRPSGVGAPSIGLAPTPIDPARLAAYQRLCGYRVSDRLPPTYPHVLAFPLALTRMVAPDFPFPAIGLIHIENSITQSRALTLEDELALQVEAAQARPHPSGTQIDVLASARLASGETVWTSRSTYLRRERVADRPRPDRLDEPLPVSALIDVPGHIGRRYAAVSGDRNPIHTSALAARAFGFPRAIAHGMWLKARALASLDGRLPAAFTVDVAFRAPVLLPSRVALASVRDDAEWTLELSDPRSGRRHLRGAIHDAPA